MEIAQPETFATRKIVAVIVMLCLMVLLNQYIPTLVISMVYLSLLGREPWDLISRAPRGWTKEGTASIAAGLLLMIINQCMWAAFLFIIIVVSAFGHNIEQIVFPFLSQEWQNVPDYQAADLFPKEIAINLEFHSRIKEYNRIAYLTARSETHVDVRETFSPRTSAISEEDDKDSVSMEVAWKTSNDIFAVPGEEREGHTFDADGDVWSTAKHTNDGASGRTRTVDVPHTHRSFTHITTEGNNPAGAIQSSSSTIDTKSIPKRLNGRNPGSTDDSGYSSREQSKRSLPKQLSNDGSNVDDDNKASESSSKSHARNVEIIGKKGDKNGTDSNQHEDDDDESSFQSARDSYATKATYATSDTEPSSFETADEDSANKAAWSRARAVAQTRAAKINPVKIVYIAQGACQAGVDADWIPKPFRDEVALYKGANILKAENVRALFSAFTIQKIGKGGNGHVYSFHLPQWPEPKAVKYVDTVRKPDTPPGRHFKLVMKGRDDLEDEFLALSAMDHPNLVKVYALNKHWDEITTSITMEQMDGDLDSLLKKTTDAQTKERILLEATHSTLSALEHMHSRGYVHRDIKSGNILYKDVLSANGDLCRTFKVADLGWVSQKFGPGASWRGSTEGIYPPEVKKTGTLDRRFDVWSCFMMLANELDIGNFKNNRVKNEETVLRMQTIAQDDPRSLDFDDWIAFEPEERATAEVAKERVDLMLALPAVQTTAGDDGRLVMTRLPVTIQDRETRTKSWATLVIEKARSEPEKFFASTGDLWTYDRLWDSHAAIMKQLFPPGSESAEEMNRFRGSHRVCTTPGFESFHEGVETWQEKLRSTMASRLGFW